MPTPRLPSSHRKSLRSWSFRCLLWIYYLSTFSEMNLQIESMKKSYSHFTYFSSGNYFQWGSSSWQLRVIYSKERCKCNGWAMHGDMLCYIMYRRNWCFFFSDCRRMMILQNNKLRRHLKNVHLDNIHTIKFYLKCCDTKQTSQGRFSSNISWTSLEHI